MRLNVLIAGAAGQGINEIANLISRALAAEGFFIFNYRDYGSLITGGHNFNIISFSDKPIMSHELDFDIVLAMNEESIGLHSKNFSRNCVVICNKELKNLKSSAKSKNFIFLDTSKINKKIENVFFAGCFFKILGLGKEIFENQVKKEFKGKSLLKDDLVALSQSYSQNYKFDLKLKEKLKKLKIVKRNCILTGAEAVAAGAIDAGLNVYFAYPMTPSTSLLNILAQNQYKYNYFVFEPENEIAVANMALGASFSGAEAMIGTSGGGFDLMTEALSMQGMAELPLVVYLAQRPGPSTGVPTYSTQADLNVALYGGHGEFPRIVVAPGDVAEGYEKTVEAFYLANKFDFLSIILVDKHLVESQFTVNKLSSKINASNVKLAAERKFPGKQIARTSSYEHDLAGNTIEDEQQAKKAAERRKNKTELLKQEIKKLKLQTYKVYGNKNAKNIVLAWGSTKGAILDSLKLLNKDNKFIQVIYLEPFPTELKNELENKNIILVENNATGQFADVLAKNTGIIIPEKNKILKYDARVFTPSPLAKEIERRLR